MYIKDIFYKCAIGAFVFFISMLCNAQQPGGVSGTKLWYTTNVEGNTYYLKEISGNGWGNNFARNVDDIGEVPRNLNINFHPAVYFGGDTKQITLKNFAFAQATAIGIFYPDSVIFKNKAF